MLSHENIVVNLHQFEEVEGLAFPPVSNGELKQHHENETVALC
jgi:hypothetical protein